LHTHTQHSDGKFTLRDLAAAAKSEGIECIAVTDHNTTSSWSEIDDAAAETGIAFIKGMELTTFFGHLTTLGLSRYVEWRDLGVDDLDAALDRIHAAGGLAVIAHPFRPGNPFCTGCHFDFNLRDRSKIDGIEVWSEPFPGKVAYNARSTGLWADFANAGFKPTALYGRDWHGRLSPAENESMPGAAVSFVGITEDGRSIEEAVLDGIRRGRVAVSMGPLCTLRERGRKMGRNYSMGESVNPDDADIAGGGFSELTIEIDYTLRPGKWKLDDDVVRVTLESQEGVLDDFPVIGNAGSTSILVVRKVDASRAKWIRAALHGSIDGYRGMIGFTNPIWTR